MVVLTDEDNRQSSRAAAMLNASKIWPWLAAPSPYLLTKGADSANASRIGHTSWTRSQAGRSQGDRSSMQRTSAVPLYTLVGLQVGSHCSLLSGVRQLQRKSQSREHECVRWAHSVYATLPSFL